MNTSMPGIALQLEIAFLNHRLEVIELWPDSDRKSATQQATCLRLQTLCSAARGMAGVLGGHAAG